MRWFVSEVQFEVSVIAYKGAATSDTFSVTLGEHSVVSVGRLGDCSLVLDCPERLVSRVHAKIFRSAKSVVSIDNVSAGSVLVVNDNEILPGQSCDLNAGDRILIGRFELKLNEVILEQSPEHNVSNDSEQIIPKDFDAFLATTLRSDELGMLQDSDVSDLDSLFGKQKNILDEISDSNVLHNTTVQAVNGEGAVLRMVNEERDPTRLFSSKQGLLDCRDSTAEQRSNLLSDIDDSSPAHSSILSILEGAPSAQGNLDEILAPSSAKHQDEVGLATATVSGTFNKPSLLADFNLVDAQEASTHKIEAEQEDDIQAQTSQLAAKAGLLDGLNFLDVDAADGVSPTQESQTQTTDQTASSNLLAGLNVADVQSTQVINETYEVEQTEAVEQQGLSSLLADLTLLDDSRSTHASAEILNEVEIQESLQSLSNPKQQASEHNQLHAQKNKRLHEQEVEQQQSIRTDNSIQVLTALDLTGVPPVNKVENKEHVKIRGQSGSQDNAVLKQAFAKSCGINPDILPEFDVNFVEELGAILLLMTEGAVRLIRGRTVTKHEMRANLTIIATEGNNPLKFAPDAQSAVMQLLGYRFPGFMTPQEAIEDAFRDLAAHQVGLLGGARNAVYDVIGNFSPERLEEKLEPPSFVNNLLPSLRKAKLWDTYNKNYSNIAGGAREEFEAIFEVAFTRAYEREIENIEREG